MKMAVRREELKERKINLFIAGFMTGFVAFTGYALTEFIKERDGYIKGVGERVSECYAYYHTIQEQQYIGDVNRLKQVYQAFNQLNCSKLLGLE